MRKLTTAVMRTPGSIGVVPMWNVPTSLKLGLAEDGGDEPQEDFVSERVDNRLEGVADDDADGQIDDIAAHDEFLKTVKHGLIVLTCA